MTSTTTALFLGGRSGVGKSTVALALHELLISRRVKHAVIEGDNLDLAYPAPWVAYPDAGLAEANLAAVWSNYRALGYRRVIYTNTVSVLQMSTLTAALGGDVESVGVLLRSSERSAEERLLAREQGAALAQQMQRSAEAAIRLDREAAADVHRIETDELTPQQIAERILTLIDWADGSPEVH